MPGESAQLTWSLLLAHFTSLARASMALPRDAAGDRWRAAVPPMVGLQAVTFALGDLDRLSDAAERPLALDKADMLIQRHAGELAALWDGQPLNRELALLIDDARRALAAAGEGGLEWRVAAERVVADHPADLTASLVDTGFDGDLYLPAPGITLFRGCPGAFVGLPRGRLPGPEIISTIDEFLPGLGEPRRVPSLRVPYRQFDFAQGRPVRDCVVDQREALENPPGGQPLLVAAILAGRPQPVALPPRRSAEQARLPLVWKSEN
jgi:hypothetical protein